MAQSLHIDLYGPFSNLSFGVCAIYFDLKVIIYLYIYRVVGEAILSQALSFMIKNPVGCLLEGTILPIYIGTLISH